MQEGAGERPGRVCNMSIWENERKMHSAGVCGESVDVSVNFEDSMQAQTIPLKPTYC